MSPPGPHSWDYRCWEDLTVGDVLVGPGVTVTESHLVTWAGLTGDIVSLHLNEQFAATTPFGRRIAHGPFTMSLCLGLLTQTGYFASVVAWLGLDEVRASAPVFVGDTIHPEATVVVSRLSSRAGEGIWTLEYAAINQDDQTVMTFKSSLLVRTRG